MRTLLFVVILLMSVVTHAQQLPFGKHFARGTIILNDSTVKTGMIKYPLRNSEKLRFREDGKQGGRRYSAKQLIGFKVDTFSFASLSNFKGISRTYQVFGRKSKIRNVFGRQISEGIINTFLVYVHVSNNKTHIVETYPNIVFEKEENGEEKFTAYPYKVKMGNRKYEKAKKDLYSFFDGYPAVVNMIKNYNKHEDFMEMMSMVKEIDLK